MQPVWELDAAVIKHYEKKISLNNGQKKTTIPHQPTESTFLLYRSANLRVLIDGHKFYEGPVLTCQCGYRNMHWQRNESSSFSYSGRRIV